MDKSCIKADGLWRKVVRLKNGGRCIMCPQPVDEAHHLISCSHKAHRHNPQNGVPLCLECHGYAHANPAKFKAWLKLTFPALWRFRQKHQHDIEHHPDYQVACERLQGILDGAEAKDG